MDYAATKAAIANFTINLAKQAAIKGIRKWCCSWSDLDTYSAR